MEDWLTLVRAAGDLFAFSTALIALAAAIAKLRRGGDPPSDREI